MAFGYAVPARFVRSKKDKYSCLFPDPGTQTSHGFTTKRETSIIN